MENTQLIFDIVKFALVVAAGLFAYYKFFKEGTHKQRIEFDIYLEDLGVHKLERILEIGALATNKGHVQQKFNSMLMRVRAISKDSTLSDLEAHPPRLKFPIVSKTQYELIPKKMKYYFVRPGVTQKFPVVVKVPVDWTHIQVRISFKYKGTKDVHHTERAFRINTRESH